MWRENFSARQGKRQAGGRRQQAVAAGGFGPHQLFACSLSRPICT